VQILQESTDGVFSRVTDGLIGGLIALAFTALLPRNPIRLSRKDANALFEAFKATLADIRSVLVNTDTALADDALERIRNTQPLVDNWGNSLESASAISRISPFYRWARKEIAGQQKLFEGMDLATRNLRVVARRVDYLVRDQKPREQLAELVAKFAIAVDLLESSIEDFSVSQKARKYLTKLAVELDPGRFDPAPTVSELAVLMQFRPMFIDLCQAALIDPDRAREMLPKVD
jgi:uncharacterized membrane protein YgaE (UPF0421/DUF939 family)